MEFPVFLLVLVAAVFHATWNFALRRVSGDSTLLWWAQLAGCVMLLPGASWILVRHPERVAWSPGSIACLLATGLIHALYFHWLSAAYRHGEISTVYPLARGSGIGLTAILGWLLLGEEPTLGGAAGIVLVFLGVLLVRAAALGSRVEAHSVRLALCVGGTIVAYSLVDRVGVRLIPPTVYLCGMAAIQVLTLAAPVHRGASIRWSKSWRGKWKGAVLIGCGMTGTYWMILLALREAPVAYVVAVRESSILISLALGIVLLGERRTGWKLLGGLAIGGGVVLIQVFGR